MYLLNYVSPTPLTIFLTYFIQTQTATRDTPKRVRKVIPDAAKAELDALIASYGSRRRMGIEQEGMLAMVLLRFSMVSRKSALNYLNNRRAAVRKAIVTEN